MKKFFAGLFIFLLLAAVAGYFLYPMVSDQICQRRDAEIMRDYRRKAAAMNSEKKAELFAAAADYNAALESVHMEDVFSGTAPRTTRDYQNRLNVHSGVIGELVIPKISVFLPVYHQSTETPATRNLVHVDGSSLPAGGAAENIVLAGPGILKADGFLGNIGLTDERMLENLDSLIPGDLVILDVLDRTFVYRVCEVQMLSSAGLRELDLTPGEGETRLTLVSRHNDRRLLVQTEQIPIQEARTLLAEEDKATFPENWQNILLLGLPVILAGLLILLLIEKIKGRHYRIPGEGRQTARQKSKAMEQIEQTTTDTTEGEEKP
jgi:sortase A